MDVAMRQIAGSDWDPAAGVVRRYGTLRYLEGVAGARAVVRIGVLAWRQ